MRRILVCTGVLGGGTALVFALAAATAMLFPQGALVSGGWAVPVVTNMTMPLSGGQVRLGPVTMGTAPAVQVLPDVTSNQATP